MKKKCRALSIVLVFIFILMFFPTQLSAHAVSDNTAYTYEEIMSILQGTYDVFEITENGSLKFNSINFPLVFSTYSISISDGTYYICFKDSGNMVTNGSSIGSAVYSGTDNSQKWILNAVSDGVYNIFMYNDTSKCLSVNASTGNVYISDYVLGNSNQLWSIEISSYGNYLVSESTNSRIAGKCLYSSVSGFIVSDNPSYFGFFNLNSWNPPVSISMSDITDLRIGYNRYMYPTTVHSDGTTSTNEYNWIDFIVIDGTSNIVSISGNVAHGNNYGIKKIRAVHRITKVYCDYQLTVQPMGSNLGVTPVKQTKTYWCWAACAEMVGKFYNSASEITQADIVAFITNTTPPPDVPGTATNIKEAVLYVTDNQHELTNSSIQPSFDTICNRLMDGKPIIMSRRLNDAEIGHTVVIIGCQLSGTQNYTRQNITYIDPQSGSTYTTTYQGFFDESFYTFSHYLY